MVYHSHVHARVVWHPAGLLQVMSSAFRKALCLIEQNFDEFVTD
jgi:hypothetical protein